MTLYLISEFVHDHWCPIAHVMDKDRADAWIKNAEQNWKEQGCSVPDYMKEKYHESLHRTIS